MSLSADEPLRELQFKNIAPKLIPAGSELKAIFDEAFKTVSPTVLAETLSALKKPGAANEDEARLALANKVSAISTLEGIQYYSASRKEMRTFYEKAFVIGSASDKERLADPVYAKLPRKAEIYALMKDLTFGENIYKITYYFYKDAVIFVQENINTIYWGPIPVAGKNNMRSIAAIINSADERIVYAASMVKAPQLPGFTNKIGASFSNRLDALLKWLS